IDQAAAELAAAEQAAADQAAAEQAAAELAAAEAVAALAGDAAAAAAAWMQQDDQQSTSNIDFAPQPGNGAPSAVYDFETPEETGDLPPWPDSPAYVQESVPGTF